LSNGCDIAGRRFENERNEMFAHPRDTGTERTEQ
jgi:hypothetical protein